MKRCKVIAISGFRGSGKDTVASIMKHVLDQSGMPADTVAFADPIKKQVQHIFDLNPDSVEQYDDFKRTNVSYQLPKHLTHNVTGRHIVREIGMLMRSYDENQFVEYVQNKVRNAPETVHIVTDLRFENELHAMMQIGAKIVNVTRPNVNGDGHVTEQGIQSNAVDFTVVNDGSFSELTSKIIGILESIKKEWSV